MIKNLQDELYQLEHKPAESIKLRAGMRWELECGKCSKTFFKLLVMQNLQNQYLNYVLMIINENILAILSKGIVKSAKKIMKNFTLRRQLSQPLLLNFLANVLTESKYLLNNLIFVRREYH